MKLVESLTFAKVVEFGAEVDSDCVFVHCRVEKGDVGALVFIWNGW